MMMLWCCKTVLQCSTAWLKGRLTNVWSIAAILRDAQCCTNTLGPNTNTHGKWNQSKYKHICKEDDHWSVCFLRFFSWYFFTAFIWSEHWGTTRAICKKKHESKIVDRFRWCEAQKSVVLWGDGVRNAGNLGNHPQEWQVLFMATIRISFNPTMTALSQPLSATTTSKKCTLHLLKQCL